MRDAGKIIPTPLGKWATGHSYMKVPNEEIVKHGYEKWVMNQAYGMTSFGNYDASKFVKGDDIE